MRPSTFLPDFRGRRSITGKRDGYFVRAGGEFFAAAVREEESSRGAAGDDGREDHAVLLALPGQIDLPARGII